MLHELSMMNFPSDEEGEEIGSATAHHFGRGQPCFGDSSSSRGGALDDNNESPFSEKKTGRSRIIRTQSRKEKQLPDNSTNASVHPPRCHDLPFSTLSGVSNGVLVPLAPAPERKNYCQYGHQEYDGSGLNSDTTIPHASFSGTTCTTPYINRGTHVCPYRNVVSSDSARPRSPAAALPPPSTDETQGAAWDTRKSPKRKELDEWKRTFVSSKPGNSRSEETLGVTKVVATAAANAALSCCNNSLSSTAAGETTQTSAAFSTNHDADLFNSAGHAREHQHQHQHDRMKTIILDSSDSDDHHHVETAGTLHTTATPSSWSSPLFHTRRRRNSETTGGSSSSSSRANRSFRLSFRSRTQYDPSSNSSSWIPHPDENTRTEFARAQSAGAALPDSTPLIATRTKRRRSRQRRRANTYSPGAFARSGFLSSPTPTTTRRGRFDDEFDVERGNGNVEEPSSLAGSSNARRRPPTPSTPLSLHSGPLLSQSFATPNTPSPSSFDADDEHNNNIAPPPPTLPSSSEPTPPPLLLRQTFLELLAGQRTWLPPPHGSDTTTAATAAPSTTTALRRTNSSRANVATSNRRRGLPPRVVLCILLYLALVTVNTHRQKGGFRLRYQRPATRIVKQQRGGRGSGAFARQGVGNEAYEPAFSVQHGREVVFPLSGGGERDESGLNDNADNNGGDGDGSETLEGMAKIHATTATTTSGDGETTFREKGDDYKKVNGDRLDAAAGISERQDRGDGVASTSHLSHHATQSNGKRRKKRQPKLAYARTAEQAAQATFGIARKEPQLLPSSLESRTTETVSYNNNREGGITTSVFSRETYNHKNNDINSNNGPKVERFILRDDELPAYRPSLEITDTSDEESRWSFWSLLGVFSWMVLTLLVLETGCREVRSRFQYVQQRRMRASWERSR